MEHFYVCVPFGVVMMVVNKSYSIVYRNKNSIDTVLALGFFFVLFYSNIYSIV